MSLTATPCEGYALGQNVTLNFTITAQGPGSSGDLALGVSWPTAMNVISAVLTDPAGLGKLHPDAAVLSKRI
jgi:hypothetical protein